MSYATVEVVVEVPIRSNWGNECLLSQVFKQASDEAKETLNQIQGIKIISINVTAVAVPHRR